MAQPAAVQKSSDGPHTVYMSMKRTPTPYAIQWSKKPRPTAQGIVVVKPALYSPEKHPDEPRCSEANVQAEFYHHARLHNLPVYLELFASVGRIDIAVLCRDRSGIVAVVECKRHGHSVYGDSWQIRRYKKLGVPVYGLSDWFRAERLVLTIQRRHADDPGISWAQVDHTEPLVRRTPRHLRDADIIAVPG